METLVSIAIVAMACATVYIACNLPQTAEKHREERASCERRSDAFARQLKGAVGSTFEFGLKDASFALGSAMSGAVTVTASVLDCDDEWVLVSFKRSGKAARAMIRYSQIESLKELRDHGV